jgi:very-short-patch-repair endonuclease
MPEQWQSGSDSPNGIAKVRLAEVAARQWGVVSRAQLAEIGVGRAVMSDWVRQRRLHRIHPRVYAVGHPGLSWEGRLAAALFYAGPDPALFGVTACSWLGLLDVRSLPLHVCTRRRRKSLPGVVVHGRRAFERVWHKGLPVTPPVQTVLDIADQVETDQLRRALSQAEYLKLVTMDEVVAALGRGRPGSAALRAALECHQPRLARTKSRLEEEFLLLCERHLLTPPEVNVWVAGWKVDAVWFAQNVVVELDSKLAHGTAARLERDHRRDLDLRAAGYTVRRYTWRQVTETPELVIRDLEGTTELARERGDRHGEQHREEDDRPGRTAAAVVAEVEQR